MTLCGEGSLSVPLQEISRLNQKPVQTLHHVQVKKLNLSNFNFYSKVNTSFLLQWMVIGRLGGPGKSVTPIATQQRTQEVRCDIDPVILPYMGGKQSALELGQAQMYRTAVDSLSAQVSSISQQLLC